MKDFFINDLQTEIRFGKYKGSKIIDVWSGYIPSGIEKITDSQFVLESNLPFPLLNGIPSYIFWAIRNLDSFILDEIDANRLATLPYYSYEQMKINNKILFPKMLENKTIFYTTDDNNPDKLIVTNTYLGTIRYVKTSIDDVLLINHNKIIKHIDSNTSENTDIGEGLRNKYNKYGGPSDGYGGSLSDRFIDDALDGFADAYWNID